MSTYLVCEGIVAQILFLPCDDHRGLGSILVFLQCQIQSVDVVGVLGYTVFLTHEEIDELVREGFILGFAYDVNGRIDFLVTALEKEAEGTRVLSTEGIESTQQRSMHDEDTLLMK